ncbi:MAG TPA: Gfo/Idh/MocA family oxidoreductase [Tepidisphaeraceae bacterium]|nr:Gfo/Idh/MocA family oxidoreductase [Tepidisphaeraceae bacterium]
MSERPLGIGIVGLGFMGATHLKAYQQIGPSIHLAAVCDSDPSRRTGRLSTTPGLLPAETDPPAFDPSVVHCYTTPAELFADPAVDLVSICTPTPSHVSLAEQALRAGKHVVLEKPVAITPQPIEHLAQIARQTSRLCMPAMCMRFWPAWSWLKQKIDDQSFGPLLGLSLTRMGSVPSWSQSFFLDGKQSGGALIDLHLHDVDFLYHLFGKPSELISSGFTGPSGRVDRVSTLYRYPTGPSLATAESSWESPGFAYRMRYVASFQNATADFDISRPDQLLLCHNGSSNPLQMPPLNGYDMELRAAVQAVLQNDHSHLPTLDQAAAVTRILLAEEQSALTRQPIAL